MAVVLVFAIWLSISVKEQSRLHGSISIDNNTLEREKDGTGELIGRHLETLVCNDIKEGEGLNNIPNIAYWFNIPEDNTVRSEYKDLDPNPKYVTLEASHYGYVYRPLIPLLSSLVPCHLFVVFNIVKPNRFNNIRIVWETAVVFAAATGRTLVLPPIGPILFMKSIIKDYEGPHPFTFDYFYPIDKLSKVVDVITTEEFLQKEVRNIAFQ